MNKERLQWIVIAILFVGLVVFAGIVFNQNQQLAVSSLRIQQLAQEVQQLSQQPSPAVTTPAPVAAPVYVSCRMKESAPPNTSSGNDAQLYCTDSTGKETLILASVFTALKLDSSSYPGVESIRFMSGGQTVLISLVNEADVQNYGFYTYNLRTGVMATFPASGMLNPNDRLFTQAAYVSPDGRYVAVGGGNDSGNYVGYQTIYVFDLQELRLVDKISAPANASFLFATDCFRSFQIHVEWKRDSSAFEYSVMDKPPTNIPVTKDGVCDYAGREIRSETFNMPS